MHGSHFADQAAGTATYLVAWEADEPLGSGMVQWAGCVGPNARAGLPSAVEINHLQVRPDWRGRGVGTAIIQTAEQLAHSRGRDDVAVAVADDNPAAARLYRRLGYEPTGIHDVCSYSWTDDAGLPHDETEYSETFVKHL